MYRMSILAQRNGQTDIAEEALKYKNEWSSFKQIKTNTRGNLYSPSHNQLGAHVGTTDTHEDIEDIIKEVEANIDDPMMRAFLLNF